MRSLRPALVAAGLVVCAGVAVAVVGPSRAARPPVSPTSAAAPASASASGRVPSAVGLGNLPPVVAVGRGTFGVRGGTGSAVSYDPALLRAGASAAVSVAGLGPSLVTLVRVSGLPPGRYGAQAHDRPCGRRPADAGPAFRAGDGGIRLRDRGGPGSAWFEPDRAGTATVAAESQRRVGDRLPASIVLFDAPLAASGRPVGGGRAVGCVTLG